MIHPYDAAVRAYVTAWVHFLFLLILSIMASVYLYCQPSLSFGTYTVPHGEFWMGVFSILSVSAALLGWTEIRTAGDTMSEEWNKLGSHYD